MKSMNYEEAIREISELPRFSAGNKPGDSSLILEKLGHPEKEFSVIHVAGTNGKGSVCAFLESIFRKCGYKTGLFTSPHLIRFNERFQIDRENVNDASFVRAYLRVKEAIAELLKEGYTSPNASQVLFGIGMEIFREAGIDVLVMETGLGGRLDATNAVKKPDLTVITSISLDHMEYLGDTVPKIAAEKAGIIKEGVPLVYDDEREDSSAVLRAKALEMHAETYPFEHGSAEIMSYEPYGIRFSLSDRFYENLNVEVPFLADYQVTNASVALDAAAVWWNAHGEGPLPVKKFADAVSETHWSGRMECVLPHVILDGAHNADGIAHFLSTVKRVAESRSVGLLFTAVSGKEYGKMVREISEAVPYAFIITTEAGGARKMDCEVLAAEFRRYTSAPVTAIADPREAFRHALMKRAEQRENCTLFCAGSLYLVGEIEAYLRNETVEAH